MLNYDQLNVGAKFKGNVNGVICEIMKIENPVTSYKTDWKGDSEPIRTNSAKTVIIEVWADVNELAEILKHILSDEYAVSEYGSVDCEMISCSVER